MSTLLDTNVLLRAAQPGHTMHQSAVDAVDALRGQGEELCLVPQNLYEFWVVATRPVGENGLGLTVPQTQAACAQLKQLYALREDTPALFAAWEQVVAQHQVIGKNAHDARLVAAMLVHGIARLISFNSQEPPRLEAAAPAVPREVAAAVYKALAKEPGQRCADCRASTATPSSGGTLRIAGQ